MTIEQSHGKARPTLPRSSDLATVTGTDDERSRQRDSSGRFAVGNNAGIGRGAKAAVRRMLGRGAELTNPEALAVARDADRLFLDTLRELPSTGSTVRHLAALHARHAALAAFWSARASEAGLGTDEGTKAEEQATKHGQRQERVAVTMIDVATKLASRDPKADPLDLGLQLEPRRG